VNYLSNIGSSIFYQPPDSLISSITNLELPPQNSELLSEAISSYSHSTLDVFKYLSSLQASILPKDVKKEFHERFQKIQAEVCTLAFFQVHHSNSSLRQSLATKESLRILKVQHESLLLQFEETRTSLLRAEKKYDRLRSSTVQALERPNFPVAKKEEPNGIADGNGSGTEGIVPVAGLEEGQGTSGTFLAELDSLRQISENRQKQIEGLRGRNVELEQEVRNLHLRVSQLWIFVVNRVS
jgi:hypothetical protein